jgi:hypothetical protein
LWRRNDQRTEKALAWDLLREAVAEKGADEVAMLMDVLVEVVTLKAAQGAPGEEGCCK